MKKNNKPLTDFEKLQLLLEEMSRKQKISDQKTADALLDLNYRITTESARTRQEMTITLKEELQTTKIELQGKLENMESRLNKRLTHVADLITIQLGDKIQGHEKRIKKLEPIVQTHNSYT